MPNDTNKILWETPLMSIDNTPSPIRNQYHKVKNNISDWWENNGRQKAADAITLLEHIAEKKFNSALPGIVAHTFAEPAVSAAEDYLRRNISVPIQKKLGITPNPYIKRNASYSPFFNHRVKKIVGNYLNDYYPDWRKNVMNGDTLNFPIGGNYYVPHYGGSSGTGELSLPKRMLTTLGQTETTLGSFRVQVTNNGKRPVATVLDTYDFEPYNASDKTLYGKARLWANDHLTPDSAPDNEKILTKLTLKLKYGGHIGYLRPYTYAIRKNSNPRSSFIPKYPPFYAFHPYGLLQPY